MIRIFAEEYKELIENTLINGLKYFNSASKDVDIEVSIISSEDIRELNKEQRQIDKVTDVLSFQNIKEVKIPLNKDDYPFDLNPIDHSIILGEIYICLERAIEQANEYGHSIEREIAFLTCHGLLHLLGFDHDTKEKEEEMMSKTEEILKEMGLTRSNKVEKKSDFKSGFIAIIGRPNAGKSTLINTIVKEKVAIVSWKPQTTRDKILGIYNAPDCQIVFIDTPGLYKPRNVLGEYMMKSAKKASNDADAILYLVDCEKGFDEQDKKHIEAFLENKAKVVVGVNKIDHVTKQKVMEILTQLNEYKDLQAVVPISALRDRNIEPLLDEIKKLLTDDVKYYGDDEYTDKNLRFIAGEIIREKALRLLDKEVPYGIGVDITQFIEREDGIIEIEADIVCEKDAHKPIILGKGGEMIKKIATYSRQDLETITGNKVFIKLFVRVEKDWRLKMPLIRDLGYDPKNLD